MSKAKPADTATLNEGDKAPAFTLPSDGGGKVSLKDFKGQVLVLYFYPKDDTPGCTKEAIAFTEKLAAFEKAGATVVGVSKDSVAKHDSFKAKHNLGVILASDDAGEVVEKYGSWVEKNMYGRNGVARWAPRGGFSWTAFKGLSATWSWNPLWRSASRLSAWRGRSSMTRSSLTSICGHCGGFSDPCTRARASACRGIKFSAPDAELRSRGRHGLHPRHPASPHRPPGHTDRSHRSTDLFRCDQ
jgi:peroxiredoxin Q/BCP